MFSENFVWGAATSSYQVEGGAALDGKGLSIWDTYTHQKGTIANDENGDVACDHYNKFKEDIHIMKQLGLKAYRFSFSWPRLFPHGDSERNEKGFEFYDRLIDELLDNDIIPFATIYHWDLPQALEDKGGFLWDGISDAFEYYAAEVAKHFSGKIEYFSTINEPQIISLLGYKIGVHAPGKKLPDDKLGIVMKNLLLCHGKAVTAMRRVLPQNAKINVVTTGELYYPCDESAEALEKARELSFINDGDRVSFTHSWFLDPVCLGINHCRIMNLSDEDMKIINVPIDSIGINIYNGHETNAEGTVRRYTGFPRTALSWPITEKVMNYGLTLLYERYKMPIYICENGIACNDKIYLDGKVHDLERIDFMTRYLREMKKAINKGVDIRGYFHWSLLDNFEWHTGYDPRFGLVFVDYNDNLKRIIKDSGYYYKTIIEENGAKL